MGSSLFGSKFATTMNYLDVPQFAARARLSPRPATGKLSDAFKIVAQILRLASTEEALLLASSWGRLHPDVLACALIGFWPRRLRPVVVLSGCMWEPNSGPRGLAEKLVIKLADRAICRYAVQSTEELTIFPELWGVDPAKLSLCLFCLSLSRQELTAADTQASPPSGDHIFAGGNSHRDYEPLLAVARQMPEHKFILATRLLDGRADLPPNVTAGQVSHRQFMDLLAGARANIIPIRQGLHRAVGQQTYLTSMWFGRPTIVTDTLGVRDHLRDGKTGLIVDGSPQSYMRALEWVLDPGHQAQLARLTAAARRDVQKRFTRENHANCLLKVLDQAVGAASLNAAATGRNFYRSRSSD